VISYLSQETVYRAEGHPGKEGVIQYQLEYQPEHNIDCEYFAALNGWRSYLFRLGLIGQQDARYDGLGYGNISHRLNSESQRFIISGTQTGHLPLLCREHYVVVDKAEPHLNRIVAHGPVKPSSEALTHGALYLASPSVQCVMHVHSPLIWRHADTMKLPATSAQIPYGTPQMAEAVKNCVEQSGESTGAIAMQGHEDGILVYSDDIEAAGGLMLELLVWAHHLTESSDIRGS